MQICRIHVQFKNKTAEWKEGLSLLRFQFHMKHECHSHLLSIYTILVFALTTGQYLEL
jgi:hypothetical protein